jgi:hypothetical protein
VGERENLAVKVEPQAPYRITWLEDRIPPRVVATWRLKRVTSSAVTERERLEEIGSYLERMGDAGAFGDLKDTPYTIIVLSNQNSLLRSACAEVAGRIVRVLRPS